MKQSLAIKRLNELDKKERYVFLHRDLAKVFHEDSPRSLTDSLARLVKALRIQLREFRVSAVRLWCGFPNPYRQTNAYDHWG